MQIQSSVSGLYRSQATPAKTAVKAANTQSKENFFSHFSGPDDVKADHDSYGTLYYESASPVIRLQAQYDRWKAQLPQQEAANLPDSTGLTEENIAYLKEHYSGELTWMEREDALNVMQEMGIISGPQKFSAHSGSDDWFCLRLGDDAQCEAELNRMYNRMSQHSPLERDWNVLFEGKPIASFLTIDDILEWAKGLPEETLDPLRCRVNL